MAVVLTDAQLDALVQSASWKFDVDFRDGKDSVVYTGDGVEDLNQLINALESTILVPKVFCDVGQLFSSYIRCSVDDVYALRSRYISFWGTVNKPPYWERPRGDGDATEL